MCNHHNKQTKIAIILSFILDLIIEMRNSELKWEEEKVSFISIVHHIKESRRKICTKR